jgi:hypothetical protein
MGAEAGASDFQSRGSRAYMSKIGSLKTVEDKSDRLEEPRSMDGVLFSFVDQHTAKLKMCTDLQGRTMGIHEGVVPENIRLMYTKFSLSLSVYLASISVDPMHRDLTLFLTV